MTDIIIFVLLPSFHGRVFKFSCAYGFAGLARFLERELLLFV
jgi:hypothetical protein